MSKTTHANLEQKNLANVFSDFLKQVIDGCDIFSSMKETFITIIESLVGGEESRTKRPRLDLDEPLHGSAGPDEIVPPVFGAEVSSQPAEVGIGSSNVPPAQIPKARTGPLMKLLEGTSLLQAIMTSSQWRWERNRDTWQESGQATDTIAALIPDSTSQDISFVIKVGHDTGWKLIEYLKFESSSVMRAPPITF
ncbi:hypothetical protein B0T16DRAFT_395291 [Cercophora newfieldiana]|uniref:Uncharacterized protein n=1 Tax=Cercophora newfieldiana TaxID=92897 RepID=A0AA39XUZ5_9PEZI|nr:hypothetical protein B0T16DRAFT_395291 [Cercophora newfieldiana]